MTKVLVAGGGVAGVAAAVSASEIGADVTIAEGTGRLAPNRCLLPGLLSGAYTQDEIAVADHGDLAARFGIEVRLDEPILAVDTASKLARTRGGRIAFDSLVVATGSSYERVEVKGASRRGVLALRAVGDYETLSESLSSASHLAIIGPIPTALALAEAASRKTRVSVFLGAASLPEVARRAVECISEAARLRGVSILRKWVETIVGVQRAEAVISDGVVHPCDLVAILPRRAPSVPVLDLARGDHGGLAVDASMRTSNSAVFAAGDCAEQKLGSGTLPSRLHSSSLVMGTIAGTNAAGGRARASVSRCVTFDAFGVELCTAGVDAAWARGAGLDAVEFESHGAARGFDASLVFDRTTHRLYGVQVAGPGSLALSECVSLAVSSGASLEDLAYQESPCLPRMGRDRSPISLTAGMALVHSRG